MVALSLKLTVGLAFAFWQARRIALPLASTPRPGRLIEPLVALFEASDFLPRLLNVLLNFEFRRRVDGLGFFHEEHSQFLPPYLSSFDVAAASLVSAFDYTF